MAMKKSTHGGPNRNQGRKKGVAKKELRKRVPVKYRVQLTKFLNQELDRLIKEDEE